MTEPERPVVTIVSKQRLVGATNGSSAYLLALARSIIAAGCEIDLIQPSPDIAGRTPVMRLKPEMDIFTQHRVRGGKRQGNTFLFTDPGLWSDAIRGSVSRIGRLMKVTAKWTKDRPRPYSVATPWQAEDFAFLQRHIRPQTRLVIADYMFTTPAFETAPPGAATAVIMHDLFHARDGKGADSVAMVSRTDEIAMLARADSVIAIQREECRFIEEHVPGTHAILAQMPAQPVVTPNPGQDDRLLFIGSNTAPNSVGLRHFLTEIWPSILRTRPDCRLDVAGTVDRAFGGCSFRNVRFLGMVDRLEPLYRDAGIVISPLTFGSGLKIKLIEALAQGKAMVVSGVTLQGVEDVCGPAVRRADSAEEWLRAVTDLTARTGERADLAASALQCARTHFSEDTVHADLRHWVRNAVQLQG